jgi:hypothetical protein
MAVNHLGPPPQVLKQGLPRLIEKLSQVWKGRAVGEGGAVKPDCQECCKDWLRSAGAGSSAGEGGGCGRM